jgi:hypothetical protein
MTKRNKFVDDYNIAHLMPLVGGVITQILIDEGDEGNETCYGLGIQNKGKKYDCIILCDPEGNGPGHLHICEDIK